MPATHGNTTTTEWNGHSLGEMDTIGDIDMKADTVDVSTFNVANFFKKFKRSLIDTGEIPLTCNFDPTDTDGQMAFNTDFYAGTERNLVFRLPASTGAVVTIPCIPTGLALTIPKDNVLKSKYTVKPNGMPVLTITESAGLTTPFFAVSDSGTISPNPANAELAYVLTFANGVASFTITPTAAAGVIEITANGVSQTVTSGVASSAITAPAADDFIDVTIKVTETNKAPVIYTLHCQRAAA
jgi:hypothetical protein